MPAPAGSNALTLGRPVFDKSQFRPDTDPAVVACLERIASALVGAGWPSAAQGADNTYMAVYAQSDGLGAHNLYGGSPADPLNPTALVVSAAGSATVIVQEEGSTVGTRGTLNFIGSTVTAADNAGSNRVDITVTSSGSSSNSFETIAVSGQGNVVADSATDTLTLVAGSGIAITTTPSTDSVTIATSGLPTAAFTTIAVSGQSNVVADSASDTLTLVAGSNVTITTDAATDSITIASTGGGGSSNTAGLYIDISGTDINVDLTEVAGYDLTKTQLIGHAANTSTFELKTLEQWLTYMTGYVFLNNQSIGHDASDTPEWQNDGVCT